jgi:hypothetical protein
MHDSILSFGRKRYLWIALTLCASSLAAYLWHDPIDTPSGGTWLGYTLGGIGAALILWLLAFGLRKRSYRSTLGTVRGWLSAHVYLGVSLLLIASLHSGWQFGWNVHTFAYFLMCAVVLSGMFGVFAYLRYPLQMSANRSDLTRAQMLEELAGLDQRSLRQAASLPREFTEVLQSNRDRTLIGGSLWALLGGRDRSRIVLPAGGREHVAGNADQGAVIDWLSAELSRSSAGEHTRHIQELLTLLGARRLLLRRLVRDAQIRAWLQIWLYAHIPLSFALLAALIAHVVSVFLYW